MTRIDQIMSGLLREGKVSMLEVLAITAAVRTVGRGLHPSSDAYKEHVRRYGTASIDGVNELLSDVPLEPRRVS